MKTKKIYKSAVSGRFVSKKYSANSGRKTTFAEKVGVGRKGKK